MNSITRCTFLNHTSIGIGDSELADIALEPVQMLVLYGSRARDSSAPEGILTCFKTQSKSKGP
jgi:hypothetical protein